MPRKKFKMIFFLLIVSNSYGQKSYLSNLRAEKNSPIYLTYAAPMQRSNFVLDEGYEFKFNIDSLGADFVTDTGGDIGIGFKMNKKWVYKIQDMYKQPVVTSSYPDMVTYEFYPFKNIKVEALFAVHSSTASLLDIKVYNNTGIKAVITVIPFMRNNYRAFNKVKVLGDRITFNHEEYPDGWTIDQKLPYTDSIQNVFLITEKPDFAGVFSSENLETAAIPFSVNLVAKPIMQVNGRIYLPGNVRIPDAGKTVRLQLFVDEDYTKMITEKSPVLGGAQPVIDNGGYFRLESALLNPLAKKYFIAGQFQDKMSGNVRGTLGNKNERRSDINLEESTLPASIEEPLIEVFRKEISLHWKHPKSGLKYSVYRRNYAEPIYKLVANQISNNSFTDKNIKAGDIYGYVVIVHENGFMSIHSPEVNNLPKTSFSNFIKKYFLFYL